MEEQMQIRQNDVVTLPTFTHRREMEEMLERIQKLGKAALTKEEPIYIYSWFQNQHMNEKRTEAPQNDF